MEISQIRESIACYYREADYAIYTYLDSIGWDKERSKCFVSQNGARDANGVLHGWARDVLRAGIISPDNLQYPVSGPAPAVRANGHLDTDGRT